MDYIVQNLNEINKEITEIAKNVDRQPEDAKLLAVSKTKPVEDIQAAYDAGQRMFGENRIQELEVKVDQLPSDIEWHLIGHLQGNKAVKAVKLAAYIHSVDSVKLLNRLERLAGENGTKPKILLEINVSGEASKFGMEEEAEVLEFAKAAVACQHLELVGLMTMAPFGADDNELRSVFAGLRKLRDKIEQEFNVTLPELSMGMSSDYKIAIEEGSTMVRIGTAIFGKRN